MSALNPYLTYKRDTSRLIFWVVRVSNTIIRTSSRLPEGCRFHVNTTGQVSVAELVALSKLIAAHINPVPRSILALFDSVIRARSEAFETFQQINETDLELERSNASHKHFIDALVDAFEVLGGWDYVRERDAKAAKEAKEREAKMNEEYSDSYEEEEEGEDLEEALFSNKFMALSLDDDDEEDGESDSDGEGYQEQAAPKRRQQRRPGKGKKSKGGKAGKKKKATRGPQPPKATTMDDIPVDSYRIMQDEEGDITDYLIAVYALFQEMASLRCYVQAQWRNVAYHEMNAAAAGAISHMAVNFVQRTAASMFLDFPGHDSYEKVLNAITRGDINKVEGLFSVVVHIFPDEKVTADNMEEKMSSTEPFQRQPINIREQFQIYTFDALVDFIVDFQKTRTGKPTKAMLQEINDWDPNFDIEDATDDERVKWRRSFTINWLYDLVNVYSSVVIERNKQTDNRYPLDKVDWSRDGPWEIYRRVYGLADYAGFLCTLCWQKPGTDVRSRILPHHVFQLQAIVDSMAMSRGWIATGLFGHQFRDPPPDFDAQRDIKLFLDKENKRMGHGFLQPADLLRSLLIKEGTMVGEPTRHEANYDLLMATKANLLGALGRSEWFHPAVHIPPSRFSATNVDGMWDYCPYLCGVGLEEALRETYHRCLIIFDKMPEGILLLHIHNMLVQKGIIEHHITLFATLSELYSEALYSGGKKPTKKYAQALRTRVAEWRIGHPKTKANEDFWTLRKNLFFKRGSLLLNLNAAGWNPDRIPDADISVPSTLALHRIAQNRPVIDPTTGKRRMEDTPLVKRAREVFSEEQIIESVQETPRRLRANRDKHIRGQKSIVPDGYTQQRLTQAGGRKLGVQLTVLEMLELVKADVCADICGTIPLSALNFAWVMVRMMTLFTQIENALAAVNHPHYVRAYQQHEFGPRRRTALTYLMLESMDEECMRIVAREFESPRAGFLQHIYWNELELDDPAVHHARRGGNDPFDLCTVM